MSVYFDRLQTIFKVQTLVYFSAFERSCEEEVRDFRRNQPYLFVLFTLVTHLIPVLQDCASWLFFEEFKFTQVFTLVYFFSLPKSTVDCNVTVACNKQKTGPFFLPHFGSLIMLYKLNK